MTDVWTPKYVSAAFDNGRLILSHSNGSETDTGAVVLKNSTLVDNGDGTGTITFEDDD